MLYFVWKNEIAMKKKHFTLPVLLLLLLPLLSFTKGDESKPDDGGVELRAIENATFKGGEKLTYRVHYGWVTAGTATLEVEEKPAKMHDRDCYRIVGRGVTAKSFNAFFPVNDSYVAYVDRESLLPWKYQRQISEGSFRSYTEVEFDHFEKKVYEKRNHEETVHTYDVPINVQDVLSAMYYARTQDYTDALPGDIYKFQNFIDRKVWDLDVEFIGYEDIKVSGTKYRCVHLKPLVREGGLFQHEGDLHLWISADENRIPIRIESGLVIGSIKVDLKSAENLKNPFYAKLN